MSLPEADVVDLAPKRLQVVVLVADDLAPEMRATIEAAVKKALDKFFMSFGGEIEFGSIDPATPRAAFHITDSRSYAGPRRKGE